TFLFFLFTPPSTTQIYTLSLHDALPICFLTVVDRGGGAVRINVVHVPRIALGPLERGLHRPHSALATLGGSRDVERVVGSAVTRSEEHTSELQSRGHLVCSLLLEKKKKK